MARTNSKPAPAADMRQHATRVLAHQQAQALPLVVPQTGGPKGQKLARNLGHGLLRPDIGKQVRRTQQDAYCGTITGRIAGVEEGPNRLYPERVSRRFLGEFVLITFNGEVLTGVECFLPSTIERALVAALKQRDGLGEPIGISLEVWCEYSVKSPTEFSYVTYDRRPKSPNDPLMALAYEAGIFERPATALPAPEEGEVDSETGEVTAAASAA